MRLIPGSIPPNPFSQVEHSYFLLFSCYCLPSLPPCVSQVSDVTEGVCWWLRPLDRGLGLRPRTTEEPEPRTEETRGMCLLGPGALSLFHMIISLQ